MISIAGVSVQQHNGRPTQFVQCNYCDQEEAIPRRNGLLPPEAVSKIAGQKGWKFVRTGKHVCPKCLGKFKEIKMNKKEDAPREMTPADKRKIFRAIDENYDERGQRYIDTCTDQVIAKELSVPRKWVSDVREQDFGPSGSNDEMQKVSSAIGRLAGDAKAAADAAMEAATVAEKVKLECEELKARLEALEASVGPRRVA